jgi:cytochrome c oxidase assembly protein subunit 15
MAAWSGFGPSPTFAPGGSDVGAKGLTQRAAARDASGLAAGFGALVALCFGLIVLGALVRVHGAGLACPDWPLCFGRVLPEMNLEVAFEWTHRVVAGCVALCFVALSACVLRHPALRSTRPLLAVAATLLALQILLGALTVWKLLAPWTVTAHLLIGNSFAATLLLAALAVRDGGAAARRAALAPAPRRAVALAAALLAFQIALGGLVASRYAGLACPEWPACRDGVWFPTWEGPVGLQLLHRANAYALVACLAAAAWAARSAPALRRATRVALLLGVAQVGVGAANVLLELPVEVTGLHSALAAALVLSLTWAGRELWLARAAPAAGARA